MAAAIFRDMVQRLQTEAEGKQTRKEWRIESAGTWASEGNPVVRNVQQVMQERGLDVSDHLSRSISRDLLEEFNLVLTMERGHKEALQAEFPDLADRIYLLSEMANLEHDVEDPIGGPVEDFRATAKEIEEILRREFERIHELAKRRSGS